MTSATPLEDRLRAHFAERAANEPLPGPDTETALAELRSTAEAHPAGGIATTTSPLRWLAIAAAAIAVAGVAAALAIHDRDPGVSTGGDPEPEPTTVPTTSPTTSTSVSTSTTTGSGAPSATATLVLGRDGPIGGWDGERWVEGSRWKDRLGMTGDEDYQLIRLDDPITTQTGSLHDDSCNPVEPGPPAPGVELSGTGGQVEGAGIAVTGVADPRPRPVESLDPAGGTYQDDASGFLLLLGIDDPSPDVRQVVRADLDGDGTDEVLVNVQRITDLQATRPDDYSVVFLQRVVDGGVGASVVRRNTVAADYPGIEAQWINAVADLNGDGRLEIAIRGLHFEGSNDRVYEVGADGTADLRLDLGCGV